MSLKIMVVDDELETLNFIKAVLEPLGHQVAVFTDSREAAERVNKQRFEVAFLDVRMPYMDGFELTRRIRESKSNNDIAIVMFTGAYDTEVIRKASKEGVTFFLTKPFNPQRVSGLLNAMDRAMWKEVRRFARLPLRTPVTCRLGDKQLKLESVNVSEGGMLLEPSRGLKSGEEVSLEFTIVEVPEPVNPRARVVRKEPADRVAVEFVDLALEDRKAIQRYITGQGQ